MRSRWRTASISSWVGTAAMVAAGGDGRLQSRFYRFTAFSYRSATERVIFPCSGVSWDVVQGPTFRTKDPVGVGESRGKSYFQVSRGDRPRTATGDGTRLRPRDTAYSTFNRINRRRGVLCGAEGPRGAP